MKRPQLLFPNLTRTAAALEAFDAAHDPQDPGFDSELAKAVGVAFGLDTSDRNNPEDCAALVRPGSREPRGGDVDLSFVRRMVRAFNEQVALADEIIYEERSES
jgi:hypothetical protein